MDRQPLDARATTLMVGLCALWGLQQVVLKATARDFAPVLQIALRSGIAALLVAGLMRWRGESMPWATSWRPGLAAGALFALEYLFVGLGLRWTSAAHMSVLLYTAPIWAALGLHLWVPSERLAPLQWAGVALAFAGIVVVFGVRAEPLTLGAPGMLWGDALGLAAGIAWGATTVVIRTSRLAHLPATPTLLYQLLMAFALLTPAAALMGQAVLRPSAVVWASLAFHAVVVSFASFLVWFWLLRHYLASRLGVLSFLTPLFGMGLGAWLLQEPLQPSFVVGAALVLAGAVLVNAHGLLPPWLRRRAEGARTAGG